MSRLRWIVAFVTFVVGGAVLVAQNPVTVTKVGGGAGTTVDTNSGNKSAGTQRVVLATDQPALTNALKVDGSATTQPVSQATAANLNATVVGTGTFLVQAAESGTWNITNVSGTVSLPTGASTSALQTTGNTALTTINTTLGTPFQAGASIGNTVFNVKPQDAGGTAVTDNTSHAIHIVPVDPATGTALTVASSSNGTVDSGTTRVAIASNNSAVSGMGVGATGSAPPVNAVLNGGLGSGATGGLLVGITVGDTPKTISITSGTTTLIVTGVSGRHVYVTHLDLVTAVANNVAMISGTGATCGTGTTGIAGGTTAANGWNFAANGGLVMGTGLGMVARTTSTGDSVCLITSAAGPLAGSIVYAIY